MKRKGFLILLSAAMLFTACSLENSGSSYYTLSTRSFNVGYYSVSSISALFLDSLDAIVVYRKLDGEKAYFYNSNYAETYKMYDSICNKYRDTSFNKSRTYTYDQLTPVFMAEEFSSVSVKCAGAYDAAHPAGSEMGDIVKINTSSEYPFIESGYKTTYDWTTVAPDDIWGRWYSKSIIVDKYQSPVLMFLNDIKDNDLAMIGGKVYYANMPFCILKFTSKPAVKSGQTFDITFTADDGKKFSCTAEDCIFL